MIGRLTGRLASKAPDQILLDVSGVGYLVHIPLSTFYELPEQESPASLWIHTHVREDALALYGFLTERERSLFLLPRLWTFCAAFFPYRRSSAMCCCSVRGWNWIPSSLSCALPPEGTRDTPIQHSVWRWRPCRRRTGAL